MRTAWRAAQTSMALVATWALLLANSQPAHAGDFDLKLGRLCEIQLTTGQRIDCGAYRPRLGDVSGVIPDNAAFRSLMSELGVLFAPNVLAPAETFGWGGFTFAVEFGFTTLNPKKNSTNVVPDGNGERSREGRYWRAAESVPDNAFEGSGNNIALIENNLPQAIAPTVTLMLRKGLWLPVPSFELGIGVRHLIGSRMWSGIAQAKISLHEGYQGLPLPAFSIRGMGSRVFNTPGFNLTMAGLDFSISKHFGIASTFNLMPYVGYQLIWIIADSSVIDATPNVDGFGESLKLNPNQLNVCSHPDCNANFTFDDQADILRHRFFIGMRLNFYIVSFLLEYNYFAAGREADNVFEAVGAGALRNREVRDQSGAQHSINFAVALDY
ncbi:MAG: hypothetical protein KC503_22030 [Myxococcales bacterium]|nr:hypothetical protein [Myxococcales bacterium]